MKTGNLAILSALLFGLSLLGAKEASSSSSYTGKKITPWSAAWVASCSRRYRSFNPKTGFYRNTDATRVFCKGAVKRIASGNSNPWPPYPRFGKTFLQWQDCVFGASGGREGYLASECDS